jgi:hypothetical protein
MTVEPDPLAQGGTASIRVEGVSGTSIQVKVDNGEHGDRYREQLVTLGVNDQGVAEGTWEVPTDPLWDGAVFTVTPLSDIDSITRLIVQG